MTTAMRAVLCCLATIVQLTGGTVVFPRAVNLTIPVDFPTRTPFYQVVALDDTVQNDQNLNFTIGKVKISAGTRRRREIKEELFSINNYNGEISLVRSFREGLAKKTYDVEVKVNREKTRISVKADGLMNDMCKPKRELCFVKPLVKYYLPESLSIGTTFDRLLPIAPRNFCVYDAKYYMKSGESVGVETDSGDLFLSTALDAETTKQTNFTVICRLKTEDGTKKNFSMEGIIKVKDINDNAPYNQIGASNIYNVRASNVQPGKQFPITFSVLDNDSMDVNNITVRIEEDPLKFFFVQEIVRIDTHKGQTFCGAILGTRKYFKLRGHEYNFTVVFEDLNYVGDNGSKVVFFVHIDNKTRSEPLIAQQKCEISLSPNATRLTRVIKPFDVKDENGYHFKLETQGDEKIFNVTPKTGIIYLAKAPEIYLENVYNLTLSWFNENDGGDMNIIVNFTEGEGTSRYDDCVHAIVEDVPCSVYKDEETCTSSCGLGSPNGRCYWRKNENSSEGDLGTYQTCSPDIETCPDETCDELEKLEPRLCIQDCTKNALGAMVNRLTGVGIKTAVGICSCDSRNYQCECQSELTNGTGDLESRNGPRDDGSAYGDRTSKFGFVSPVHDPGNQAATVFPTGNNACGKGCIAGIFLCMFGVLVLMGIASIRCLKNWKLGRGKHKHVGNRLSDYPSAVLSNYVDERSPYLSDSQANTETSGKSEQKWEFPRENLILGETLGEGEFGKVIRAQAWGINNSKSYTMVAVKMLKEDATISEQQDLLSEFNMLKEVSHPNVIRLLGACTTKGYPLYVIVEYAEYGSLRGYLRKSRNLTFENLGTFHTVWNPTYILENEDTNQSAINNLSQRDLLSFAWQISKGMAYLSDMKLLHRDLAARNVLLAAGKVVKISDFGLSRDVYEGDAYLKKSKGRVPVKWMAIESLADNIYTTKSDVWSFGVVLWEIVTLGSSPYPGVTPERLFQLLKAGYRMEKPHNCSAELYKIMRMCWNENPHDRPSFKQLVQIFDRMLQDTAQYLSLRAVAPEEYAEWNKMESEENGNEDKVELTEKYCCVTSHETENTRLLVDGDTPDDHPSGISRPTVT